jgi:hypothetical protein
MDVFFVSSPLVIDGASVERESARQEDNSEVYSGDPGFGFKRARYYINEFQFEGTNTFFSILFSLKRRFNSLTAASVRPRIIAPEVFLSNLLSALI